MNHSQLPAHSTGLRDRDTANMLESLTNLIYLTRLEADHPEQVRHYMDLSAERVQSIVEAFQLRH